MTARAFILISTDLGVQKGVVEELRAIPNVVDASQVYGVYDIIVTVEADSMQKLKDTITYKIRRLDKIRSATSMVVAEDL